LNIKIIIINDYKQPKWISVEDILILTMWNLVLSESENYGSKGKHSAEDKKQNVAVFFLSCPLMLSELNRLHSILREKDEYDVM
jgi:hypothetical protein